MQDSFVDAMLCTENEQGERRSFQHETNSRISHRQLRSPTGLAAACAQSNEISGQFKATNTP